MGEESEERSGRIAGIVKSIFGRKKGELPLAPPPSPPQEIKLPPNVAELNLIKEKVQSVSRPVAEAGDWKQLIPPQLPPVAKTPQMDIAFKGPDTVSAPQAFAKPRQQDAAQGGPAAISAAQAQAVAKTTQQDSTSQVSAGPPAYKKSSLDEIKRSIEESAQRKNPAHLKKNIEQVNEHLNYVKRKSALSDRKIEKLVDEKIREELAQMSSSVKKRLDASPALHERERLEKFQKQLLDLIDVSDKKSGLELEQMRSQMEEMRQQMKSIPLIVAQKELEELSPIREEVAVLRGELRKSIPNISDPSERSKLEETLSRAEALSKRLEYNPQVESVRAELGEIKSSMGSFASAIEKVGSSGEELKKQESEAQESIKQGMDALKKEIRSVPEALKESESPKLDSIRRSISELRTLVQQNAEAKQPPAERRMLNEILAHLSVIEQKQTDDERKLSRLLTLDADSMKLMDSLRRRMDGVSRRVSSEGQAEMDAFREELRSLQRSVRASISSSRSEEEQDMLTKLHGELSRLITASEGRSAAALGELKGELSKVSSRLSRIPSALDAREKPEFDAVNGEILRLKKLVADALSQPKNEEEKRLLKSLQARLEDLMRVSEARSSAEFGRLEGELADVRSRVSRIPSVVGASEKPELDAIKGEILGLQKVVGDALARPKGEEEKKLLRGLQSRLEGLLEAGESRIEHELDEVRSSVSRIPGIVGARERPELDSIRAEILGLQKVVGEALSKPRDEEEKRLLRNLQSRLEGLLDASDARSTAEFGRLEGELADVRRKILRIPASIEAGEEKLSAFMGRNDEKMRYLRDLDAKLMAALSRIGEHADKEIGNVRSQIEGVHGLIGSLSRSIGSVLPADFESLKGELHSMRDSIRASLSTSRSREEAELLGSLQKELNLIISKLEERSEAQFGRLEQDIDEVRRKVSSIPAKIDERKPELDAVVSELHSLKSAVDKALAQPKNDEEKSLLKGIQLQLSNMLAVSEARSSSEFGALKGELEDVKRSVSRIPARERPELDAIRSEIFGLQRVVGDALARPKGEEEKKLLRGLQSRLEDLSQVSEARSSAEFGRLEGELADVRSAVSKIPSAVGAREKFELDAVHSEVSGLQKIVSDALSQPKNEEEKRLLKSLQARLEDLMRVSEARSSAEFGRLEGELADVRSRVSRIPSVVGASEKPELDAIKGEILGLQKVVGDALARPKGEEEKKLLRSLQSRLEELSQVSEARSVSVFGRLEKELADVRSVVSRIPSVVGAHEKFELDSMRNEISGLQKIVSDALAQPKNEEEKRLLRSLQSRLEDLSRASDAKSSAEFGLIEKELADVRGSVSRIPGIVGAREKFEMDTIHGEISGLQRAVADALAQPKNEEEKRLLKSLQSRLEELSQVSEARSVSEFGRLEKELAEVRSSVSRIPGIVGAHERPELEAIRAEVAGLQKFVSDALARPKNEEEKKLLRGLQSRLESLLQASGSRNIAEFGRLEDELADVKSRISRVSAREKPELDAIKGEILGLQKVVGDALSRPRDEEEKKLLEGMESRLENLLGMSGKKSAEEIGGLKKELSDIRRNISKIPSRVEAGEKPELDSLKGEVQAIRSTVEEELAKPRNEEERKMLRNILSQLDGLVKFFDLRAGSTLDAVKSELDSVAGQIADIRAEKGDIVSIAAGVHALGDGLKKALSTAGRKDRQALERLSAQIAALSSSLDSKAGSAADGIRSELEGMRSQLMAVVSAGQPEMDSVKSSVSSLRRMVEKALAKPGSGELDKRLSSLSAQIAEMLQVSEARTEADFGQLRQKIEGIQKELEDIPAELSAEKPEIESIRSAVSSLQESLSSAGKSSLLAIKDKLDSIAVPKPQQADNLSGIKESIASLRDLLETRIGPAEPQEGGLVPVRRPKRKAARIQKRTGKGRAVTHAQKTGKRKKTHGLIAKKRAPRTSPTTRASKAVEIASKLSARGYRKSRTRKVGELTSKLIVHRPRKSRARAAKRKSVPALRAAAKRKSVPSIRAAIKRRGHGKRSISDIDSFIANIEKRRKSVPEIERRLGGEYSTQPRRGDVGTMVGRREREEPGERRPLERDEERRAPERNEDRRGLGRRLAPEGDGLRRLLGERRALERDEDLPEAQPHEKGGSDVPEQRLHEDYDSYLKDEKIGRIGSDVKRMHARLKDIRKLYEEEF